MLRKVRCCHLRGLLIDSHRGLAVSPNDAQLPRNGSAPPSQSDGASVQSTQAAFTNSHHGGVPPLDADDLSQATALAQLHIVCIIIIASSPSVSVEQTLCIGKPHEHTAVFVTFLWFLWLCVAKELSLGCFMPTRMHSWMFL